MKIVSTEKLESTTNGWGFGGSINKVKYIMENGDVWISGTACYRHAPSENYIQARFYDENKPEWTENFNGSAVNDLDRLKRGKSESIIEKYYSSKS